MRRVVVAEYQGKPARCGARPKTPGGTQRETPKSVPKEPQLNFWSFCATMSKASKQRGGRVLVGYARTSTFDQIAGFDAQRRDLEAAGCKKVFVEQVSSVSEREQLKAAIEYLREDDVLVATKLDRVARSMRHLIDIVDQVKQRKAHLRILGMNLDTETATGRLMLQVLGAVAEHERASMLERQREGIAKAKAEGKYKGRARTAMAKAGEVEKLLAAGVNPTEVARKLGIGRSSVYRAMRERRIRRVAGVAPA